MSSPMPPIAQPADLDEWVRHIVDIHFHPAHGTPFWIERSRELGIDARAAIRGYDDLALLGFFPVDALRTRNVLDFLPAGIARRIGPGSTFTRPEGRRARPRGLPSVTSTNRSTAS